VLVLTPAHNEAANLPELYARLSESLDRVGVTWRWLLIDDVSDDETFAVIDRLAAGDPRVGAIRLERRAGSHLALLTALKLGADCPDVAAIAVLASDLQDPPEALPGLIDLWRQGAEIVLGSRPGRREPSTVRRLATRAIYALVQLFVGSGSYPASGADVAIFGRTALNLLAQDPRPLGNLFVRAAKLDLPIIIAAVAKHERKNGSSSWSRAALAAMAFKTIGEASGLRFSAPRENAAVAASVGWISPAEIWRSPPETGRI
jgi:glycosyltransferase involved in cell wall biosynthesis